MRQGICIFLLRTPIETSMEFPRELELSNPKLIPISFKNSFKKWGKRSPSFQKTKVHVTVLGDMSSLTVRHKVTQS